VFKDCECWLSKIEFDPNSQNAESFGLPPSSCQKLSSKEFLGNFQNAHPGARWGEIEKKISHLLREMINGLAAQYHVSSTLSQSQLALLKSSFFSLQAKVILNSDYSPIVETIQPHVSLNNSEISEILAALF